jgi:hypothetical protein
VTFCVGLNPFATLVIIGVAVGAGLGLNGDVPLDFNFASQRVFLLPMVVLLGVDIVLDKVPATYGMWGKLTFLARVAGGGLVGGIVGSGPLGIAPAIFVGTVIALMATVLRSSVIRKMGGRFYGLERLAIGACSDAIAVLTVLATVFSGLLGLAITILVASAGTWVLLRRPSSRRGTNRL